MKTLARPIAIRTMGPILVLSIAGVAGCSSSTSGTATPPLDARPSPVALVPSTAPSAPASVSPSDVASEAPSTTPGPTAVPTSIDPCKLVTPAEVSALTGTTFSAGEVSTEDNHRICSYGQEGMVFEVLVSVAPDAATAKQQEPAFKADLEKGVAQAGLKDTKLTEMPDFEPGVDAAVVSGSVSAGGQKLKGIALYALKGAVLVALSDIALGGSVPTSAEMQDQARVTLGRLP